MKKIVLIEDNEGLRSALESVLELHGFNVKAFSCAETALDNSATKGADCIVTDYKLPQKNGIDVVTSIRRDDASIPILMMTAFGTIELAVAALKSGANDFITKPFEAESLIRAINDVIDHRRIIERSSSSSKELIFKGDKMRELLTVADKVAKVDSTVLIYGESGTGKELIARRIHQKSSRAGHPFVAINCAALPEDLLESEFFGHEAGAFTGASCERKGLLEVASDGTIFLDEIGDMPKLLQVKLLRAIQEREFCRVGGTRSIRVNTRIIAATNLDEAELLIGERMREDLFYRLAVITITVPPLRERREDIEVLFESFVKEFSEAFGKNLPVVSSETMEIVKRYPWLGNVRELRHSVERALAICDKEIMPNNLGINLSFDEEMRSLSLQRISTLAAKAAEIEAIARTLAYTDGNKSHAARLLGVSYKTLLQKVKDYNLSLGSNEAANS